MCADVMQEQELIPHLFRTEFSKITAVLCKTMGLEHIETAEDIAGETFLSALEIWPYNGYPENPAAWLHLVARNKARNYMKRKQIITRHANIHLKSSPPGVLPEDIDISGENIEDSQLQMLFAVCHPSLSPESQIALSLRLLCGFGIEEIASALLTNKETINKRLFRAKEKLRTEKVTIEIPLPKEIIDRLDTVLTTLYLLFNEGYYSESRDSVLRKDLCLEAMRLTHLLLGDVLTNKPAVNALLALMCFHASRFEARTNSLGEMILYEEQDESLWSPELISEGIFFLHEASQGNTISKYHIEANIAYWHTIKSDTAEKWVNILKLFDSLLSLEYSPVAALNRTYIISKVKGKEEAIAEAEKLNLNKNHYYYALLGELYTHIDNNKARLNFQKAMAIAKTITDKQIMQRRIEFLSP